MLVKWPKYENILRLHEYNYQGHSEDFKLGWFLYTKLQKKNQHKISHKYKNVLQNNHLHKLMLFLFN